MIAANGTASAPVLDSWNVGVYVTDRSHTTDQGAQRNASPVDLRAK